MLKGLLKCKPMIGAWLSLVEHCVRDAGVAGSNPVAPIFFIASSAAKVSIS